MKKSTRTSVVILALVCIGAVLYSGFIPLSEKFLSRPLQQGPLILSVQPIQQSQVTSCGEAAITMAYNHAYPQTPVQESNVIAYATEMGYFTADRPPFTSPASMLKIAKHYTDEVSSGRALTQSRGLALLFQKIQNNEPVIIDVLTRLSDPDSGAHFVVVTGVSLDESNGNTILIHYNNPLTGLGETAPWSGTDGLWKAWQKNGDPGGAGWWMAIDASE
jgi:hypothetical protein